MSEIRLDGVHKRFGDTLAVNALTLTIEEGEFVVLLGPTGAGKTTTLRLVAGLEVPEKGTVWIGGRDVTRAAPAARDVAFVFQQYSLYPHYTVYDNLAFPLRAPGRKRSRKEIDARVRDVAGMLRIDAKLKNRATELSGGEMQRVSIGRALVREPTVFLMDEPLSSLDAKLREDLRVELKRIQRELGATILYVTHDQLEALTMADRIGILADGTLVQTDTPRTVYEQPANIYAAKRLGSPQINLVAPATFALDHLPAATRLAGIRPEDIRLAPTAAKDPAKETAKDTGGVPAEVLTVEPLGVETTVLLSVGGTKVHALADAHAATRPGDRVLAGIRPGSAIPFDADGRRLALPDGPPNG